MLWKYIWNYVSQRWVQKLERNWNNSDSIKVDNLRKSVNFEASCQFALMKNLKQQNLEHSFSCEKLNLSGKHIFVHIF